MTIPDTLRRQAFDAAAGALRGHSDVVTRDQVAETILTELADIQPRTLRRMLDGMTLRMSWLGVYDVFRTTVPHEAVDAAVVAALHVLVGED